MSDYMVDIQELNKRREELALESYNEMQTFMTSLNSVSFLKKNYELKKIYERKTEPNIITFLSVTWLKICMLSGLKENQNHEVWQDITNLIFNFHSDLTLEEIWKAFELERFREYSEKTEHYQFFNSEYVSAVLKKYRVWKQNTKIQHNITKPLTENLLPEKTDSEKTEILNNGIIRVFNRFKEINSIDEPCSHLYDEVVRRGFITGAVGPKSTAYYDKKKDEAKSLLEKEMKEELSKSNKTQRRQIQESLEQLQNNNYNSKLINRTKKLVLEDYFKKLISENIDLEKLLKS